MATDLNTSLYGDEGESVPNGAVVLLGRLFFVLLFLISAPDYFSQAGIGFAASQGVPLASLAVPLSGLLALAGSLSILLGYRARLGAWLIVLFLVPVTFTMHKFWAVTDPTMAQMQMINFMKNVEIIGGALLISQFGAGPWSFDARRSRRLQRVPPTGEIQ
jgi:putative oxidoreductase